MILLTFIELRREVFMILRFHGSTLRSPLCRDEHAFALAVLDCIEDLQTTLRAYTCEKSISKDVADYEKRKAGSQTDYLPKLKGRSVKTHENLTTERAQNPVAQP